jgi:cation diffusion facilitator CzcD-associated flavoprotein CzcO
MNAQTATAQKIGLAPDYEVIVLGAGVTGIYQLYKLVQLGKNVTCIDALADLGGTWY